MKRVGVVFFLEGGGGKLTRKAGEDMPVHNPAGLRLEWGSHAISQDFGTWFIIVTRRTQKSFAQKRSSCLCVSFFFFSFFFQLFLFAPVTR